MFRNRSVVEVVVLLFALTACAAILLAGAAVLVLELSDADTGDVVPTVDFVKSSVGLILGALLGLLVRGKNDDRE